MENSLYFIPIFFSTFVLIGIAMTVFWILMLIDAAKRQFTNENDKVVWILVLCLTQVLGAIIYYFVVKRGNKL